MKLKILVGLSVLIIVGVLGVLIKPSPKPHNLLNTLTKNESFGKNLKVFEDKSNPGSVYITSIVQSEEIPKIEKYVEFITQVYSSSSPKLEISMVALSVIYKNKPYRIILGKNKAESLSLNNIDKLKQQLLDHCKPSPSLQIKDTCEVIGF